ncbi:MAG: PorP/SprF family type IX secretion system membrane protein [Thermonemataceae bacterium]
MKTLTTIFFTLVILFSSGKGYSQGFYYSQFHQTPLLTNPAMVASDDLLKLDLRYRSQSIGPGGQAFITPVFSGIYPMVSKKTGKRWGGIGGMIMQDEAGLGGVLQTTGGALAFAYNFNIKPGNYISVGVQGGYYQRVLDETQLTTGNQFVTGTDDLGEDLQNLNASFLSIESGVFWNLEDTATRTRRAYIGFSARQLNQPTLNFTDVGDNQFPLSFIATAGVRVLRTDQFEIVPNGRFIQQGSTNQINAGASFRYLFGQTVSEEGLYSESSIGFNSWYSLNNALIAGIEINYKKLFAAFSYDFSLANPENRGLANGATEFMIGFRKDLGRKKVDLPDETEEIDPEDLMAKRPELLPITDSTTLMYENPDTYGLTDLQYNLLQRTILFPYKQTDLTDGTQLFLDRIVTLLEAYPDVKLEISGHTCNEGSFISNKIIAENRAITIYNYLVSKGVKSKRLFVRGYADKHPVTENDSEASRIRNRRAELRIAKPTEDK